MRATIFWRTICVKKLPRVTYVLCNHCIFYEVPFYRAKKFLINDPNIVFGSQRKIELNIFSFKWQSSRKSSKQSYSKTFLTRYFMNTQIGAYYCNIKIHFRKYFNLLLGAKTDTSTKVFWDYKAYSEIVRIPVLYCMLSRF